MRSMGSCVLRVYAFYGFTHFTGLRVLRVYAFSGLCVLAFMRKCVHVFYSDFFPYTGPFAPTRGLLPKMPQGIFPSKSDSLGAAVTIIISRINNSLSLRFHVPLSQASAMHVPESPVYLRPANASRVVQSPSRDGGRRVRPTISPLHSVAPPWGGEGWLLPPQNHSLPPHLPPLRQFLLCIFI